jgi:tRNA A58 N-methylase Trm61
MNNEPVAWMSNGKEFYVQKNYCPDFIPLYTHPAKTLTDEDIAKVVHELNQKARTPDRWVTAMEIGAETIIQLRDELAILRKAQEK